MIPSRIDTRSTPDPSRIVAGIALIFAAKGIYPAVDVLDSCPECSEVLPASSLLNDPQRIQSEIDDRSTVYPRPILRVDSYHSVTFPSR